MAQRGMHIPELMFLYLHVSGRLWKTFKKTLFSPSEKVPKRLGNTDAFVHSVHVSDASLSRSDWQLRCPFYASHLKSMTCSKSLS